MLDLVNYFVYYRVTGTNNGGAVKQSEFVRWLKDRGARFEEGSKHIKVYLNGKQTTIPRHPSQELKKGLVEGIKKQLGLK